MARRKKKPGADLGDLKARLGLNKALEKKPEPEPEPEPEPAPAPQVQQAQQPQQPAGPPPGFKPPPRRPVKKLKKKKPTGWEPPPVDTTAAADVKIADHSSRSKLYIMIGAIAAAAMVFGMAGYFAGGASSRRALYDAQTTDAKNILESVKPKADKVTALHAAVSQHDGAKPDQELLDKMENQLGFVVEPEEIATGKLLLGAELTGYLIRFAADSKLLFNMMRDHIRYTRKVDKKELEELANKEEMKASNFAIIFDAESYVRSLEKKGGDFRPPPGQLVVFDAQDPKEKKGELFVTVRYPRSGKEIEVPMKNMVLVKKSDIVGAGGQNALTRYTRRHKQIALKLQEMAQYVEVMNKKLTELSNRDPAGLLATGD